MQGMSFAVPCSTWNLYGQNEIRTAPSRRGDWLNVSLVIFCCRVVVKHFLGATNDQASELSGIRRNSVVVVLHGHSDHDCGGVKQFKMR